MLSKLFLIISHFTRYTKTQHLPGDLSNNMCYQNFLIISHFTRYTKAQHLPVELSNNMCFQNFLIISHFTRYTKALHLPPCKINLDFEVIYCIIFSAFCYNIFSSCNQCAHFIVSGTIIFSKCFQTDNWE